MLGATTQVGEFTVLDPAESYTLNDEQQIYPTNQRAAAGQPELDNPSDYVVVVWMVEDHEVEPCARGDARPACKAKAIYVAVSSERAPPKRFGFRTQDGYDWRVTRIAKPASGADCVEFTFSDEVRQGELRNGAWPRREMKTCVAPTGFMEPK